MSWWRMRMILSVWNHRYHRLVSIVDQKFTRADSFFFLHNVPQKMWEFSMYNSLFVYDRRCTCIWGKYGTQFAQIEVCYTTEWYRLTFINPRLTCAVRVIANHDTCAKYVYCCMLQKNAKYHCFYAACPS